MRFVKPSYAGLLSGTYFIISIPLFSVFLFFHIHKSVSSSFRMFVKAVHMFLDIWAGLFEAGLRQPKVSAKFELMIWEVKKQIQFNSLCLQFDDRILYK